MKTKEQTKNDTPENKNGAMSIQEHNEQGGILLRDFCNFFEMSEYRGYLMKMNVFAVENAEYATLSQYNQLEMAMMLHRLTDFLERVEVWSSDEVLTKD